MSNFPIIWSINSITQLFLPCNYQSESPKLYKATQDKKYLQAARKALIWCLENQYTGPDPEAIGSLVGRTPASAVGYRPYYPVSCAYTSGFFGLAILEELKFE